MYRQASPRVWNHVSRCVGASIDSAMKEEPTSLRATTIMWPIAQRCWAERPESGHSRRAPRLENSGVSGGPVLHLRDAAVLRATGAAEKPASCFHAVTDDLAITVTTRRRQRMN